MTINQKWLDNIVKGCMEDLKLGVSTPEEEGYTKREFAMYALRAVHELGEDDVELDGDFLDQVEASINLWTGPGSPDVPPELQWNPLYELDDKYDREE